MRCVTLIFAALLAFTNSANYEGYKVFKMRPNNESNRQILVSMRLKHQLDFWSKTVKIGTPISVMVPPHLIDVVETVVTRHKFPHKVLIEDVERAIQKERSDMESKPRVEKGTVTFNQYLRHDEINAYLNQLAENHPDLVSMETIGQSYEGREMVLVKISTGAGKGVGPKPAIFIDAGIYGRDWIAPAMALYIVQQLVEDSENQALIENIDWIVLPSLNPDGYEYTFTEDRLWRKTRSSQVKCHGVDLDRNFDYHWGDSGEIQYECDNNFAGIADFSEVEARNLRDYLKNQQDLVLYLSLHGYGPVLLHPWGYSKDLPHNWQELDALGNAVVNAVKEVNRTKYVVGTRAGVSYYEAAGSSDDWVMARLNVSLVYAMELPGGGAYGFDVAEDQILPVCVETWQGIKVFHEHIKKNVVNKARDEL